MLEKRCPKCNHLFFKVENPQQWAKSLKIQVKCPKCKELFEIVHHEGDDYDYPKMTVDGIPLDELLKRMETNNVPKQITPEMVLDSINKLMNK